MDSPTEEAVQETPELLTLKGFPKRWAQNPSAISESAPSQISGFSDFEKVDESDIPLPELDEPPHSQSDGRDEFSDFAEPPAPQIRIACTVSKSKCIF